jgi:hypothetical protein
VRAFDFFFVSFEQKVVWSLLVEFGYFFNGVWLAPTLAIAPAMECKRGFKS